MQKGAKIDAPSEFIYFLNGFGKLFNLALTNLLYDFLAKCLADASTGLDGVSGIFDDLLANLIHHREHGEVH